MLRECWNCWCRLYDSGLVSIFFIAVCLPLARRYPFLFQRISTTRQLLADSSAEPIASPITPLLGTGTGKAESQAVVSKPDKVQAVLKGIKQVS